MLDEFLGDRNDERFRVVKMENDVVLERSGRVASVYRRHHDRVVDTPERVLTKNQLGQGRR